MNRIPAWNGVSGGAGSSATQKFSAYRDSGATV